VASFVYGGEGIRMNNDLLIERMISWQQIQSSNPFSQARI
jgi:hypothetical protein